MTAPTRNVERRAQKEQNYNDDSTDDENNEDDRDDFPFEWATAVPSPPPPPLITTPAPVVVVATTAAPAPPPQQQPPLEGGGSTEDTEDGNEAGESTATTTTNDNDTRDRICRAAALGTPLTTDHFVDISYDVSVVLVAGSAKSPVVVGMTVNEAVTNQLTQNYILNDYCDDNDNDNNTARRYRRRSLADEDNVVWGITGGTTQQSDQACEDSSNTSEDVTCHRVQTVNRIFYGAAIAEPETVATSVLKTVSEAFASGAIDKAVQSSGDVETVGALVSTGYIEGSYEGSSSISSSSTGSGGSGNDSARSADKRDGLRPAGKAFLTLFLLALIGAAIFVGYKYGYPRFKEHQWKRKHNANSTELEVSVVDKNGQQPPPPPAWRTKLSNLAENIQQRVSTNLDQIYKGNNSTPMHSSSDESSVATKANSTPASSGNARMPRNFSSTEEDERAWDPNIVIAEHTSSSTVCTEGFGTEMILEDLQQEIIAPRGTVLDSTYFSNNRSPCKLSKIEERPSFVTSTEDYNYSQDAFSFSDINIIVDESSSCGASSSPAYLQAVKRSYTVPDTVNL